LQKWEKHDIIAHAVNLPYSALGCGVICPKGGVLRMNNYETIMIINSNLDEAATKASIEKFTALINANGKVESVEEIGKIITGKSKSISIKERDIERLTPLVDYISNLNKGFEGIASSDPASVKSNIDNYVKFIDKVNTVDVTKLQTSTKMFEQMSSFSSSIKGDFDKLAEALSEKLLPVLEELKEVMGVLPEKIDTGFQNTSASIAATAAPVTATNVTEQVKRENPNMTPEQIKKVVDNRIAEKSKADANGIGAKLDELMALLRGFGSDNVIVKTL
jgi:hypothetical protein